MREGKLKADDVCVLYVSRDEEKEQDDEISGSTVKRLRLNDDGEFIDAWPGGFFPERLNEMF